MRRLAALWLTCLLGLPLTGCASWDAWQRQHVYRPTALPQAQWQAFLADHPDLTATQIPLADGGHLQILHVPAVPGQRSAVRVLYLHGTLRHVVGNLAKIRGITRNGLDVDAVDYRGWGAASALLPDEASLHADAMQAWRALRAGDVAGASWVIYGHSMGSALAVRLAADLGRQSAGDYCALVLESAFTRFPDIARSAGGPLGPLAAALTTQQMDSLSHIGEVHGPIWMLHGREDRTVPIELGRRLFEAAPQPKLWLDLPGDHSDLQDDRSGRYDRVWQEVKQHCAAAN